MDVKQSRAIVLQCAFELGDAVQFGPYRCHVMAITAHVNGGLLYHIRGFDNDGSMVEELVSDIEIDSR